MQNKFSFNLVIALIALGGCSPKTTGIAGSEAKHTQPVIVIILTDDMGISDIGCFGGNFVPTPNIGRLVASGIKLLQYYSAAPICSPSRAGLLTGMYPARDKALDFMERKKDQPFFINLWPDDVHTPWVPRTDTEYTGNFPMNPEEERTFII
jgi:hypothetical protein